MEINWANDTRKLSQLKPQRDNPRQIVKAQAKRLVESWHKFNQPDVISIGPDDTIYNGHQRYYVWLVAYGKDFEVAVRVASRPLTRREWQEFTVLMHEGATGEWDFDALADWDGVDLDDLVGWGFSLDNLFGSGLFVPDFQPVDESEQPRLDQKKPVTCPECGALFTT